MSGVADQEFSERLSVMFQQLLPNTDLRDLIKREVDNWFLTNPRVERSAWADFIVGFGLFMHLLNLAEQTGKEGK